MPIAVDACAAQHQGDRKEQQDRVAILPCPRKGVALAVVADGMGGHTGGALAAEQSCIPPRRTSTNFSVDENPQLMLKAACAKRTR
jgi:serine/threonine protein phosphatase PrpC